MQCVFIVILASLPLLSREVLIAILVEPWENAVATITLALQRLLATPALGFLDVLELCLSCGPEQSLEKIVLLQ